MILKDSVCEWAEEPLSGKTICGVWKVIPPTVLKMISSNMESRAGLCLTKNHVSFYFAGNRRDVQQIAATLSPITDVLGRSFASSALLASGDNSKLSNINLSSIGLEIEPLKNLKLSTSIDYKKLKTASPTFSLEYFDENGIIQNTLNQSTINLSVDYTPNRKTVGYGVDRTEVDANYARVFFNYSLGVKDMLG